MCVLMCLQVSVRKEVGTRKMVGERVRVGHGDGAEECGMRKDEAENGAGGGGGAGG